MRKPHQVTNRVVTALILLLVTLGYSVAVAWAQYSGLPAPPYPNAAGAEAAFALLTGCGTTGNVFQPATGTCVGQTGGMVYPGAGVPNSTGSAWGTSYTVGTAASNLVQLNGSAQLPAVSAANLTNFPSTLATYPGAGVPNSTGSAWGTSYAVGTAANNLVQLVTGGALPAVSAANLTNFPTFNQSTTGNAATSTLAVSSETVTFSATPTFSAATRYSTITMTAAITSFTLASGTAGQEKTLTFCGAFAVTAPANVHGFMTVANASGKCSSQHFNYDTSQTAWLADGPGIISQ
ncbi:MAG TPA: hypothetical protein VN828_03685 [Acidobacteriaceae bacterium]|nr:hypothetical protein [Acidobacteriaceae bacterium]